MEKFIRKLHKGFHFTWSKCGWDGENNASQNDETQTFRFVKVPIFRLTKC